MKAIEDARNDGLFKKSQEAAAVLTCSEKDAAVLSARGLDVLAEIFIVSSVTIETSEDAEQVEAQVALAEGDKCPRCWNVRELGEDGLCERCHEVIEAMGAHAE